MHIYNKLSYKLESFFIHCQQIMLLKIMIIFENFVNFQQLVNPLLPLLKLYDKSAKAYPGMFLSQPLLMVRQESAVKQVIQSIIHLSLQQQVVLVVQGFIKLFPTPASFIEVTLDEESSRFLCWIRNFMFKEV